MMNIQKSVSPPIFRQKPKIWNFVVMPSPLFFVKIHQKKINFFAFWFIFQLKPKIESFVVMPSLLKKAPKS